MSHKTRENQLHVDHENSDIVIQSALNCDDLVNLRAQQRLQSAHQLNQFDELWYDIKPLLQQPIQDGDNERFSGYTGHRIVTLTGKMGRCALSFHLLRIGHDDYRTISAHRRKIYAQERRRVRYTSDNLFVSSSDILSGENSQRADFELGVMRVWLQSYVSLTTYSK